MEVVVLRRYEFETALRMGKRQAPKKRAVVPDTNKQAKKAKPRSRASYRTIKPLPPV